jgi:cell division protein FtsI/penicillin-binding protein 2
MNLIYPSPKTVRQALILILLIAIPFSVSTPARIRSSARRRAAAARRAAIARQRALDNAMRGKVRAMITKDDLSGEDARVRRIALEALGNHAGTVVVMNPKTGVVYSIINQQWALQEGFKPCSTIKLVTGLAGLSEKVIAAAGFDDLGQASLTEAMAHSKNNYFQQVGAVVGFDKMISYARRLGLGEKTGINVVNEFQGRIPEFRSGFNVNHMSSHGDEFKVTAVQLATLVSAIANGGKLLAPVVVRSSQKDEALKPRVRRSVDIDQQAWQNILPGMIGAVNYGSGRRAYDPFTTIAGKTGTCIEDGSWVGLFTSYAPLNDPKLAIVVITRGSDARNHFPATVAGRIYRALADRLGDASQTAVIQAPIAPSDGVSEDSDSADETDERTPTPLVRPNKSSNVKRVLMSVPKVVPPPTPQHP